MKPWLIKKNVERNSGFSKKVHYCPPLLFTSLEFLSFSTLNSPRPTSCEWPRPRWCPPWQTFPTNLKRKKASNLNEADPWVKENSLWPKPLRKMCARSAKNVASPVFYLNEIFSGHIETRSKKSKKNCSNVYHLLLFYFPCNGNCSVVVV